jgi:phenylpropionate dioxygenase-like ring-hydroxylating dioxygenase large terminal subunit
VSAVTEPKKLNGVTPSFPGDLPQELVPEKYRLGRGFVPKSRYLDPEFQALEFDKLFTRTWLMACREEEISRVGSYVEYELGSYSILVLRDTRESIKAFYNSCRHRGTRLATGCGRVGTLICPFHGWRWNLDGSIRLILDQEEFDPVAADNWSLISVRCETWGGFVFINMDPTAEPLLDYLSPIPQYFAPFQFENMRVKWWKSVPMPCNWKTALDGFLEAYHTIGTHPQLMRSDKHNLHLATLREIDNRIWSPTTTYERHAHYSSVGRKRDVAPDAGKTPEARGTDNVKDPRVSFAMSVQYIFDDMKGLENPRSYRAAEELKTAEIPADGNVYGKFLELYRDIAISEGFEHRDITPEQWAQAGTAWNVFPNLILLPNQGSAFGYRARPTLGDPDSCTFEVFALEQVPTADYDTRADVKRQHFDDYNEADLGDVFMQDMWNAKHVTVGMHAPSYDGHRLSEVQEMTIYNHHRVANRYIFRAD